MFLLVLVVVAAVDEIETAVDDEEAVDSEKISVVGDVDRQEIASNVVIEAETLPKIWKSNQTKSSMSLVVAALKFVTFSINAVSQFRLVSFNHPIAFFTSLAKILNC